MPVVRPPHRRHLDRPRGALVGALVSALLVLLPATPEQAAPALLSPGKPVTASSRENYGTPASDGVRLAGFLIDAGPVNCPTPLEIGPTGATVDHSANPTTIQDVYYRIGGAGPGKATTSLVVDNNDTITDHTWVWRADHGDGVGWDTNRADYGVRVKGDEVLATGLFVKPFNKYDVEWHGERGRTVFFQNEKAYDAPNQAVIQNGATKGYAAYKVDDSVTTHEAWGMGSYCNDTADPSIRQDRGFEAAVQPEVKFHDLLVASLGGSGQYEHVIDDTGQPTSGTSTVPSTVVSYP
jgi:hypothetical protein